MSRPGSWFEGPNLSPSAHLTDIPQGFGGPSAVLAITLQDLRFRARRFLIASIGAALVFAMTLLLSGLAAGFSVEINRPVRALGARSWVVAAGSSGRMVALSPLSAQVESQVAADPGAGRVGPVVIAPQVA